MSYSITKQPVDAQPVLVARKKAAQGPDISKAIGDGLGAVFTYAQQHGIAITGRPFSRYPEITAESMTIEPGVPIAAPDGAALPEGEQEDVHVEELPGGFAAHTLHQGPYETLHEAYAALERWIGAQGLSAKGAPWEVYITDPTQVENPADWKTEIYWPVR